MKSTNIGLIGCGRIAGHHCRAITKNENTNLIAVCDLDLDKAQKYADKYNVSAYTNYREMLSEEHLIDTVAIITPSGMHYKHAQEIVKNYRKNIIVEKPTFLKTSHFYEILELAKSYNLEVFPVFQNRHNLAVQRVRDSLLKNELGKINLVSVRVRWCRPQTYYDLAPWRGTFAMDGGCLTNQGIHHLDLMRYLGGEISEVNATMRTFEVNIEVEDTVVGTVRYKNGSIGTLEVTTAARPQDYEASISIIGSKGIAQIGGIAVNELQIFSPNPDDCAKFSEDFSGCVYGNGHYIIYDEVCNHMNKLNSFSVNNNDAMKTVELLNAFYKSHEENRNIELCNDKFIESTYLGKFDKELSELYSCK